MYLTKYDDASEIFLDKLSGSFRQPVRVCKEREEPDIPERPRKKGQSPLLRASNILHRRDVAHYDEVLQKPGDRPALLFHHGGLCFCIATECVQLILSVRTRARVVTPVEGYKAQSVELRQWEQPFECFSSRM